MNSKIMKTFKRNPFIEKLIGVLSYSELMVWSNDEH